MRILAFRDRIGSPELRDLVRFGPYPEEQDLHRRKLRHLKHRKKEWMAEKLRSSRSNDFVAALIGGWMRQPTLRWDREQREAKDMPGAPRASAVHVP